MFCLVTDICVAVTISELKPVHSRPFLLPQTEKKQLLNLIATKDWAKQEFKRLQDKAEQGDGYSAAFLFALTDEQHYLEIAKTWLREFANRGGDLGVRALNANDEFFNQGMPWLGDVFYQTNSNYLEVFDYIYTQLSPTEKTSILKGITASADFRQKSMDAWWQTANLVFKPTSMVAIAGLVTQDPKYLDWGFFRKPGSHLGGYFSVLDSILKDNGPWYEAPIYAISHLPLYQSLKISDFLSRMTGQDWFNRKLNNGSSVRGLMDYYINTTYPAELRADGKRDYRILTYGDGATGQRGDLYLTNHNSLQRNLVNELALAYKVSKDPDYAAFLNRSPDYQPDLFTKPEIPASPLLPKAPSSIWPDFGLAFLRSDDSRNYWTNPNSIAASLLFRQGYGHGHADALSITLFGAGQLFYPDYNAIQYENPAIGWTASSVAHNTVVVDGNNSSIPDNVQTKHEFKDDFRFVQAQVDEPLGISKRRTLALTSDYLLDVFHLKSLIPRTYDYLLHSFGAIETEDSTRYASGEPFSKRYKNITDFATATHNGLWQLDFVIDSLKKQQNVKRITEKFTDTNNTQTKLDQEFGLIGTAGFNPAKLNFKMAAHPNTKVGLGEDEYGLSFLAARRENTKQTTFATLHSPSYKHQQASQNNDLETLFESNLGTLIKVTSDQYIDIHAISFQDDKTHLYDSINKLGVEFTDYALIRIRKADELVSTYGELGAYSIAANLIGTKQDLHSADYRPITLTSNEKTADFIQVNVSPQILVLKDFADSTFTLSITNKTNKTLSANITLPESSDFAIPQKQYVINQIPAYQTVHQRITLGRYKKVASADVLPLQIRINNSNEIVEHGIMVSVGPGLIRQFEQLEAPVYRVHTYDSKFDFSMRHSLINRITDDYGEVLFAGASLFDLSDGKTIISPTIDNIEKSYTWADQNNVSIISEVNNLIRWHTLTIQNRFYVKLDNVYTRLNQVFFVFDKRNQNFNWQNAAVLATNKSMFLSQANSENLNTNAIEIPFANSDKSLCIKTIHTKQWRNNDDNLSFPLTRNDNDQFGFGICDQGSLVTWAN